MKRNSGESMGNSSEMGEYRAWKSIPALESYANGGEAARIRMLLRGGYLPLRGNEKFRWRDRNILCGCGDVETEEHWLFQCNLYNDVRRDGQNLLEVEGYSKLSILKGYTRDEDINGGGLRVLERMWNRRKLFEKDRAD